MSWIDPPVTVPRGTYVPYGRVNRIQSLRLQRGLSQSQLAVLLGVHQRTVRSWEAGVVPRKAMQRKIARVLLGSAGAVKQLGYAEE